MRARLDAAHSSYVRNERSGCNQRRAISRTLPLYQRLNSITWRCDVIQIQRSGQLMQYADRHEMYAIFHDSLVFYDRRDSGDTTTRCRRRPLYCYQNIFHWTVYGHRYTLRQTFRTLSSQSPAPSPPVPLPQFKHILRWYQLLRVSVIVIVIVTWSKRTLSHSQL